MRTTMLPKISAALTLTLLLAACGKGGNTVALQNATMDQVAATKAVANSIKPGEWEMTAETVKQEVTGGPAALANMPKAPPTKVKICITPEQASKPEAMLGGKGMEQFKKSCVYDKFVMAGGSTTAEMHCDLGPNMKIHSSSSGTFSDSEMSTTAKSEVSMGAMVTKSEMKMTAHRLGECQAADVQAAAPKPAG